MWPWNIPINELRARGKDRRSRRCRACRAALPPASFPFDDPTQSLTARGAAKLLAGAATVRVKCSSQPGTLAAKKIGIRPLDADPRRLAPETCDETPRRREAPPGLQRPAAAGVRRSGIDTAGFGPAVFARPLGFWRYFRRCASVAAIAEPPRGTRGCNIELGDGWGERASRIP